jgi:CDP-paratose 2-epimerase
MYIREYHELYDVPFVINRPSSVYGPRQNGTEDGGWLSWFVKASLMNERITLFGNGTQSRDALYIDDHIDLLVEEVEEFNSFKNEDFDFGGGQTNEVTLLEALKYLRYENYTFAARLPGDIQRFVCDNEKIKQYTAWCPKIQWKVGVDRTVEYLSNTSRK